MTQIVYTDPGQMNRQIDIWDQPDPANLPPVLFASGVYAQIQGMDSTTLSTIAPALDQNTAWPRLNAATVSTITHKIIIRYRPGLKSRMFIVYNDPDNGPRRFEIDRIVDPDEYKVELRILAFERSDGGDPFDAFLTSLADILLRNTAIGDKRGIGDPTFETVATGIRCRVTTSKSIPRAKEYLAKTKLAIVERQVYMRPWYADPDPSGSYIPNVNGVYNTQPLTHDHWLRIPSQEISDSGELYDIFQIDDPGLQHQRLEVWCRIIQP